MNDQLTTTDYILPAVAGILMSASTTLNFYLNGKANIISEDIITSFFNLKKCTCKKKGTYPVTLTRSHQLDRHRNEPHEEAQEQAQPNSNQSRLPHHARLAADSARRLRLIRYRKFLYPQIEPFFTHASADFDWVRFELECARLCLVWVSDGRGHIFVRRWIPSSFCVWHSECRKKKFFNRIYISLVFDINSIDQSNDLGLDAGDRNSLRRAAARLVSDQSPVFHLGSICLGRHFLPPGLYFKASSEIV